jgi:hypothetical protein
MHSLIPDLAARTVQEADLGSEWIEVFLPLFHIDRLRLDDDDWIAVTFDYLGTTNYCRCGPDDEDMRKAVSEAAVSFGHSLRGELERFGRLEIPASEGGATASSAHAHADELSRLLRETERTSGSNVRLRPRWSPATKLVAVVVGVAAIAFVASLF